MRSDSCALSRDRLLCYLNQDLLTFAEKLRDRRLRTAFAPIASATAARVLTVPGSAVSATVSAAISTAVSAAVSAASRTTVPSAAFIFNFFLFLRLSLGFYDFRHIDNFCRNLGRRVRIVLFNCHVLAIDKLAAGF